MARLSPNRYPYLAALIAGALYLAFLSHNQVVDGVYYAWCGRYGHELAHPHHLLYNYWLRAIMLLSTAFGGGAGDGTIYLFQAGNAVAGAVCIGLLVHILQRVGVLDRSAFWQGLAVAGSWGFARFATDNEAYVMPILFSLLALRTGLERKWLWLAGLFSAVAILFHQVQLWWALPMLWLVWKMGGWKPSIVFAAWHLLVPAGYLLVWKLDVDQPLVDFLAGEFKAGGVHTGWGVWTVILTAVQSFRAFFQLHEEMFIGLPKREAGGIVLALLIGMVPLVYWIWLVITNRIRIDPDASHPAPAVEAWKALSWFGLSLAMLLMAFSFFSQGNAEFLAALPFAAVFWQAGRGYLQKMAVVLAGTLWAWNLLFGLRVMAFYRLETDRHMARLVHQEKADPVLLMRKLEVDWWYAYLYGTLPGNTRYWQWVQKGSEAQGGLLLYDGQAAVWQNVLFEPTSNRAILANLGIRGMDSVYELRLPGYKTQLEPIYLNEEMGSNKQKTIWFWKADRIPINLTQPRR